MELFKVKCGLTAGKKQEKNPKNKNTKNEGHLIRCPSEPF